MADQNPNFATSTASQGVFVDGQPLSIQIRHLGQDALWTLEVCDHDGTILVWRGRAIADIEADVAVASMGGDHVVPRR